MGYVSKNARRDTTKKIVIKTVVIMPRRKPKRQTTYQQRYNALSALEVHTIGKVRLLIKTQFQKFKEQFFTKVKLIISTVQTARAANAAAK